MHSPRGPLADEDDGVRLPRVDGVPHDGPGLVAVVGSLEGGKRGRRVGVAVVGEDLKMCRCVVIPFTLIKRGSIASNY